MKKYTAVLGGASWASGPESDHSTIKAARAWAESYGSTADWCNIYDKGQLVARHVRSAEKGGMSWYKVAVSGP